MAKREILVPHEPDQIPDFGELPDDDAVAVQSFITEMGGKGDVKIYLYRSREDGKDVFLKQYVPAEFSWENVQDRFGGGEFRIKAYRYSADARRTVLMLNRSQAVETPGNRPLSPDAPISQSGNSDIAMMMQGLSNGLVKLGELIVQARPVAATELEILEKMRLYKDLFSNTAAMHNDAPLPMEQTMGVLREMLSFVKENVAGESGEVGSGVLLMKALETFGKPLVELVMQAQAKTVGAAPDAAIALPAAAGHPPTPRSIATEDEMLNFAIKKYINEMVSAANDDLDPTPYAEIAMQKIPRGKAAELLNDPQWLNKLAAFNPAVLQYKGWFNELRDVALEILTAPEQASDTDAQPAIEGAHVPASTGGKSS